LWTKSQCEKQDICTDADVISKFAQAKSSNRFFAQVCAVNTILLFFRSLQHLDNLPHARAMFNTFIRGGADICWFILVIIVLICAYVSMGHTVFGPFMLDFSTWQYAFVSNFQMFLGTFRNTEAMRQAGDWTYFLYWISYMVLFRFVLLNMFLAIIAKHFKVEEEQMEKRIQQSKQEGHSKQGSWRDELTKLMSQFKSMSVRKSNKAASVALKADEIVPAEPVEAVENVGAEEDGGEEQGAVRGDSAASATSMLQAAGLIPVEPEVSIDDLVTPDVVTRANTWKYLPAAMQEWALNTAKDLYTFIEEKRESRREIEKTKDEYELDRVMQEMENWIKDRRLERGKMAEQVKSALEMDELRSLKEIHQDQESLAWYIMKRETELKKLENVKATKEERFNKLVNAAQSLISSDKADDMRALPPSG